MAAVGKVRVSHLPARQHIRASSAYRAHESLRVKFSTRTRRISTDIGQPVTR
jgi:hypothetical protein